MIRIMVAQFPFPDVVLKSVRANSPRDVLRQMMDALELAKGVDGAALVAPLLSTEQTGGSAIGDGVAVVSVRVPRALATHRYCAFAHLERSVNFRGVENHPCDLVFVLVSPEDETPPHLRDLSSIVRTLRDRDFIDRLRNLPTAERMAGLFRARDMAQGQAAA